MIDKALLTLCFGYLLVAVQAIPKDLRPGNEDDSKGNDASDCFLPKVIGPCKVHIDRYYFDKNAKKCRSFVYGGCAGNANNFKTLDECQKKCGRFAKKIEEAQGKSDLQLLPPQSPICSLPPMVGTSMCEAYMPMWTYDAKLGKCKEYIYGGCGGTKNLFRTRRECQGTCEPHKSDVFQPAICSQPPMLSPNVCEAYMPMWTYDAQLGKCKEYIYGGCNGSDNLFWTRWSCRETCELREPANLP